MNELKGDLPEGFKMTELGPLPEEWEVVRLEEVAELQQGKTPRRDSYDDSKGFRIIKVKDFENGNKVSFAVSGDRSFVKTDLGGRYVIRNGDSLVLSAAHSSNIVGQKIGYVDEVPQEKVFFVAELIRVRPKEDINPYLCFVILNSENSKNQIREEVKGGHLYPRNLGNIKIPLPPLPEQEKIAAILSAVQEAKEKTEAVISATKDFKKSMMSYLFTYGPVPLPEAENVPLKETEVGMIPEEWEVVNFEDCILRKRITIGNVKQQQYKQVGRYPIVDQGQKLIAGYWDDEIDVYKGELPVIIFGDHTRIIKFVDFPFVTGADGTKILFPNTKKVYPLFFYYALLTLKIPSRGYNRHYSLLRNFKIPLPPLPIQQKIASILSAIDQKIEAEENKKKALEDLFKTLLHNLMTAKIRVNNLEVGV